MPKKKAARQDPAKRRVPTITLPSGEVRELYSPSEEIMKRPSNFRVVQRAASPTEPGSDGNEERL